MSKCKDTNIGNLYFSWVLNQTHKETEALSSISDLNLIQTQMFLLLKKNVQTWRWKLNQHWTLTLKFQLRAEVNAVSLVVFQVRHHSLVFWLRGESRGQETLPDRYKHTQDRSTVVESIESWRDHNLPSFQSLWATQTHQNTEQMQGASFAAFRNTCCSLKSRSEQINI